MKNVQELNELWGKLIHGISFNDISRIELDAEMVGGGLGDFRWKYREDNKNTIVGVYK